MRFGFRNAGEFYFTHSARAYSHISLFYMNKLLSDGLHLRRPPALVSLQRAGNIEGLCVILEA
jgi:hypothetical protein